MSTTRRPSLNALRAFEAAARHLSFQAAAAELHVTPAALSHQVRQLESQLGRKLFKRHNRAVSLTAAGASLYPELADGFALIDRAVLQLQQRRDAHTLTVASGPSFTAKWLSPNLLDFLERAPGTDVRISSSLTLVDLPRSDIDVAIRFGKGHYPGCTTVHLADDFLTPMCSPHWLAEHPLESPADLIKHTLIDDQTHLGDELRLPVWEAWLRAVGVRKKPRNRIAFNVADHTLDAAAAGGGVVLGRTVLARMDIAAGRLVCPFDTRIPTGWAFYAACPDARVDEPLVQSFIAWLKERFGEA
ncbi:MAG: transcriptional regulator GcvA [Pseudomonadota bacterium]